MSSEKALSPLFEDSGSESSPSLLSEDDIKPRCGEKQNKTQTKKGGKGEVKYRKQQTKEEEEEEEEFSQASSLSSSLGRVFRDDLVPD